jgi:hypothetical protein
VAYFYLDNEFIGEQKLGKTDSNRDINYEIPGQAHGSHLLEIYLSGKMDNDAELPTVGPVRKDLLFVDPNNDQPIIGCNTPEISIKQYETKNIIFTVYDKNAEIPEVDIFMDTIESPVAHLAVPSNADYFGTNTAIYSFVGTEIGTHEIKIKCKEQIKLVKIIVEKLDVPVEPITTGLVFDFNPAGKNNNDTSNRL